MEDSGVAWVKGCLRLASEVGDTVSSVKEESIWIGDSAVPGSSLILSSGTPTSVCLVAPLGCFLASFPDLALPSRLRPVSGTALGRFTAGTGSGKGTLGWTRLAGLLTGILGNSLEDPVTGVCGEFRESDQSRLLGRSLVGSPCC